MMKQKTNFIYEKSIPITIPKKNNTNILNNTEIIYYDLNKNIFDPTKSSPPNNFLNKLKKRMKMLDFLQE